MKSYKIIHKLCILSVLLLAAVNGQIREPEFEIHDRGVLWETMNDDGTIGAPNPTNQYEYYPSMDWPGGPHQLALKEQQRSYMVGAGMWLAGYHQSGTLFFTEHGPFSLSDEGTFEEIQIITNYLEDPEYNPEEAEQTIVAEWTTTENIHVKRTSRVWSFIDLNNFIIMEYVFTNTMTTSVTDFFIGFPYLIRPSYQDLLAHNGWGDDFNRSDELVSYDADRKLLYCWDDAPNFDLPGDVGNYVEDYDEMRTPGYAGIALLHADPASDGSTQPTNTFYAQLLNNSQELTLVSNTKENLYDILTGVDKSLQADPEDRIVPFMLMSCGPYTIAPSEQIRIVIVEAVDGLPLEEAVKGLEVQPDLPEGLEIESNNCIVYFTDWQTVSDDGEEYLIRSKGIEFFLHPNESLEITASIKEDFTDFKLVGSDLNQQQSLYWDLINALQAEGSRLMFDYENLFLKDSATEEMFSKIEVQMGEVFAESQDKRMEFIHNHPEFELSAYLLLQSQKDTIRKYFSQLNESVMALPYGNILMEKIDTWDQISVGKIYPEFEY